MKCDACGTDFYERHRDDKAIAKEIGDLKVEVMKLRDALRDILDLDGSDEWKAGMIAEQVLKKVSR